MPAYVGDPLAGDPIWEASSASELRIAITTKQVSRPGHPSELLVAKRRPVASRDETHAWDEKQKRHLGLPLSMQSGSLARLLRAQPTSQLHELGCELGVRK